ncbi:hypothetical protein PHYPO_G00197000 [Pangasianodon hypophthalmus]|uniref:Uncharacterized protein n=1 Tax=Pangasianodon hypophthalmus TaxID=310915 RepID=A0A5N5PIY8_PANHP|nr:hypothetical protein PHYPO_G00197000 [Pangasianodon hypophthalmus]
MQSISASPSGARATAPTGARACSRERNSKTVTIAVKGIFLICSMNLLVLSAKGGSSLCTILQPASALKETRPSQDPLSRSLLKVLSVREDSYRDSHLTKG